MIPQFEIYVFITFHFSPKMYTLVLVQQKEPKIQFLKIFLAYTLFS